MARTGRAERQKVRRIEEAIVVDVTIGAEIEESGAWYWIDRGAGTYRCFSCGYQRWDAQPGRHERECGGRGVGSVGVQG